MKFKLTGVALCALLASCSGGNPFDDPTDDDTATGASTDQGGITRDGIPPGTDAPSPSSTITRGEPRGGDDSAVGDGFAEAISYDSASDTFTVDGLAFDGDNTYARGNAVSDLGTANQPYAVYEADAQTRDPLTGDPVNQFTHRAIYGVSRSGNTEFAIVRTGAYAGYGFGGFIYQRNGGVVLPSETPNGGDARYTGTAAGVRDFEGIGGLQYSRGDMEIAIDFDDFNEDTGGRGDAVRGRLDNRQVYDINGNDITNQVVQNINNTADASLARIPTALFVIQPGAIDDNGEIVGQVTSQFVNNDGRVVQYEEGNYYAVVAGDNAEEIVGIMVLENNEEAENVTVRDTSGFIVYR